MKIPIWLLVFACIGVVRSQPTADIQDNAVALPVESNNTNEALVSRVVVPVLETLAPMLQKLSEEILRIRDHLNLKSPNSNYEDATDWNNFATGYHYVNTRMFTSQTGVFAPKYIPKESTSLVRARKDCSWDCANNQTCQAFNFYDDGPFYVCELLPDNLCINKTRIVFASWPGGTVWDKTEGRSSISCANTYWYGREGCEKLRPGCLGTWPNCHSCVKTCLECKDRYSFDDDYECTLWPAGSGPFSVPVLGHCKGGDTYLTRRKVNLNTAELTEDYRMSLQDANRVASLQAYPYLQFQFIQADDKEHTSVYKYEIDKVGTLSLTLDWTSQGDVFHVGEYRQKTMPFVKVTDDPYGCGSFWLVDPSNATYCPGGEISMFGEFKTEGRRVVSTGMSCPKSIRENQTVTYASILLKTET